jgi:hypothetical protein
MKDRKIPFLSALRAELGRVAEREALSRTTTAPAVLSKLSRQTLEGLPATSRLHQDSED